MKIQTTFYLLTILICSFFVSTVKINKKSKINTASLTTTTVSVTPLEISPSTESIPHDAFQNLNQNLNGKMNYLSEYLNPSFLVQKQEFNKTITALSDQLNGTLAALAFDFNGTYLGQDLNKTKSEEKYDFNGTYLGQDFNKTKLEEKYDFNGTYLGQDFNKTMNSSISVYLKKQFSTMRNFTAADFEEIEKTLPTSEEVSNWLNHQVGNNLTTASDVSFTKNYEPNQMFLTKIEVKEHYVEVGFSKEQMKEILNRLPTAEQLSSWVNSQVGRNVTAADSIKYVKDNLPADNQIPQIISNLKAFLL